ncbi:TonB-dependent siderophore receptor [Methylophaga sp.]|uniref:TonB-dependent siderophore receptor n=1 Tax=Methylophaga sp. TaxID=2024840 RepID=UPI003F697C22
MRKKHQTTTLFLHRSLRNSLITFMATTLFSTAAYAAENAYELDTISVQGNEESGYAVDQSKSLTKTRVPLSESPFSVQVIPETVFTEQNALGLEDVYRNVSGVVESGNTLNAQSEVLPFIRGFESPTVLRNGIRATQVGAVDLFNIESVEVLKGPASILFGALEPGGVLNYTTKKPRAIPSVSLKQQFGSDDYYRTTVDATGPVNENKDLLYRFNLAYTDSQSFRDEIDLDRIAVSPVITWLATDQTELTLDFSYTRERVPYDSGVPVDENGDKLVPDDTFFGDPSLEGRTLEDIFAGYTLEHQFNSVFTLTNRLQFHRSLPKNESIRNRGVIGTPGNEQLRLRYQNEERVEDELQFVTDLTADFDTGSLNHQALIGLDLIKQESEFRRFRQNLASIDINANPDVSFTPPSDLQLSKDLDSEMEWAAVYFHDQISMLEDGRLKLLVGGRYDSVKQTDNLESSSFRDQEFTGRAGLLYELTPNLSPYVSVSESFNPQSGSTVDRSGAVLAPETGLQYEAGLKLQSLDKKWLSTIAVYEIEKEDVAVFDSDFFNDTGEITYFPGVEQRSRGVEFDISGEISPGLNLIANYAYTDTEVLKNDGDPDSVGERLGNVPLHTARLWLSYDFQPGSRFEHFGLGGGVRYESERLAQFDTDITLDDYTVYDAALWYRKPVSGGNVLTAQLNFRNVFDEDYYARASDQSIVHAGLPFSVYATVGLEF